MVMKRFSQSMNESTTSDFKRLRNEIRTDRDNLKQTALRKAFEWFNFETNKLLNLTNFTLTSISTPSDYDFGIFNYSKFQNGDLCFFMDDNLIPPLVLSFENLLLSVKERLQCLRNVLSNPCRCSNNSHEESNENRSQKSNISLDFPKDKVEYWNKMELEENLREAARRIIGLQRNLEFMDHEKEVAILETQEKAKKLNEDNTGKLEKELERIRIQNGKFECKLVRMQNELLREKKGKQEEIEKILGLLEKKEKKYKEMRVKFKTEIEKNSMEIRRLRSLAEERRKEWIQILHYYEDSIQKKELTIAGLSHSLHIEKDKLNALELENIETKYGNFAKFSSLSKGGEENNKISFQKKNLEKDLKYKESFVSGKKLISGVFYEPYCQVRHCDLTCDESFLRNSFFKAKLHAFSFFDGCFPFILFLATVAVILALLVYFFVFTGPFLLEDF